MTALKRRVDDQEDGRYWLLYGTHGVMSWTLLSSGTHGPIAVHSPRPQFEFDDEPSVDCPFLEGACYVDAGHLAGDRLGGAWEAAGRDDEVIWRELVEWYEARLLGIYTADEVAE